MLILQEQSKLESYQGQLKIVENDILKLNKLIQNLKDQESDLLSKRSDLIWKIEEVKEVLNNEEINI